MRKVNIVGMMICVAAQANGADWSFPSEIENDSYLSVVTTEMIEKSPPWLDSENNPPLSAREAIIKSRDVLKAVFDPVKHRDIDMRLGAAALTAVGKDKWVWVVRYDGYLKVGGTTGLPPFVDIVVLMDGQTIVPKKQKAN